MRHNRFGSTATCTPDGSGEMNSLVSSIVDRNFASIGMLWGSFVAAEQDYGNAWAVQWQVELAVVDDEPNMLAAYGLLVDWMYVSLLVKHNSADLDVLLWPEFLDVPSVDYLAK